MEKSEAEEIVSLTADERLNDLKEVLGALEEWSASLKLRISNLENKLESREEDIQLLSSSIKKKEY